MLLFYKFRHVVILKLMFYLQKKCCRLNELALE